MTSWQKRLRGGIAVFAIAFAGLVYVSIRERQPPTPQQPVERQDPRAISESRETTVQQVKRSNREFDLEAERILAYEDGSQRLVKPKITIHRPGEREFVITADEARAGTNQVELELNGGVTLSASDGFRLQTEKGTFNQETALAKASGEVTFAKGRMSGSGLGASYDQRNDILTIAERGHVVVTDDAGRTTFDGRANTVMLDRLKDVLFLETGVHLLNGSQVIDADQAMARLSPNEDVVTYQELRGGARVRGVGATIESMSADAIDIDYTDDGTGIERVILNSSADLTTSAEKGSGRRMSGGDGLDVTLAPDGTITALTGRGGVRLDLPVAGKDPARSIRARTLDATGEPGKGLTAARFRDEVVFQERESGAASADRGGAGAASREVRAQSLNASLDGDAISNAFFSGGVSFEERGLRATAAEARYQPVRQILNLTGRDGGMPSVSDDQIRVDARTIDVVLDGHGMEAMGNVRTVLGRRAKASGANPQDGRDGKLPGLLRQGEPVSVNAQSLDYRGGNGRAVYSGGATLVQGDTSVRGETIVLDQQKGDLVATGAARSTLVLDSGRSEGRAAEIRYDDARRVVAYRASIVAPTREGGAGSAGAPAPTPAGGVAQLSSPDGDLRAERIEIVLAREGNTVDRLEAYTNVTMMLGPRIAVGSRLTYHAHEERYVMSGGEVSPVTIRESCRETTGRTLTFFKQTDRIVVDGNETRRTETRPCAAPSAR